MSSGLSQRNTASGTPHWRDQFSKAGWRVREAKQAMAAVKKRAGQRNGVRNRQPSAEIR